MADATSAGINFSGLASGIDTGAMVTKLVAANSVQMQQMQARSADLKAASSAVSDIGKLLATLKSSADALDQVRDISSLSATSSNATVTTTTGVNAQAGSYDVTVNHLAREQRNYSAPFASRNTALGQDGSFTIQVGTGASKSITVDPTDTLDSLASKINSAGLRVGAAVFYDGSKYRLQLRGLDTGSANNLTFDETDTTLDLAGATTGQVAQTAMDADVTIDNYKVTSANNHFADLVPGVSLDVAQAGVTTQIKVAPDSGAMKDKVKAVVAAFNQVIFAVHTQAGFGDQKAKLATLSGDSTLRGIEQRLDSLIGGTYGTGTFKTFSSIGVSRTKDGLLTLDETKFNSAVATDSVGVTRFLGADTSVPTAGFMDKLKTLTDNIATNSVQARADGFTKQAKSLDERADKEQTRLDAYEANLKKQFSAMEDAYSQSQAQSAALSKIG
jgi:flagellar hook-associated protein 2